MKSQIKKVIFVMSDTLKKKQYCYFQYFDDTLKPQK